MTVEQGVALILCVLGGVGMLAGAYCAGWRDGRDDR